MKPIGGTDEKRDHDRPGDQFAQHSKSLRHQFSGPYRPGHVTARSVEARDETIYRVAAGHEIFDRDILAFGEAGWPRRIPSRLAIVPSGEPASRKPITGMARDASGHPSAALMARTKQPKPARPRSFPLESDALPSIYHPYRWCMEGDMAQIIHQLRPKPADSEKITINLGYVDLGQIDLMVQEGFYSNWTDFIRSAIRNQLERHADVVKQSALRKSLDLGLRHYSRDDLEAARRAGEMLQIHVLGLASIALDVTPELARATIASVVVLGSLHASPAVKDALADRMR